MRIGVDIRCLMDTRYSGISEYAYNLFKELFSVDSENKYILYYNAARATQPRPFDAPNIEYKAFRYPNILFNLGLRFLKFTSIDSMMGGVDVFITPNFLFTNVSGKCKKILIVHDLSFEHYPEFFTFKQWLWHTLIGPGQLCHSSDAIIAISKNTARDIISLYGVDEKKISVIYPGVSDTFFKPITQEYINSVLAKYQLSPGYIYSLGNLEPRKNILQLLAAFEQVDDQSARLVIAGAPSWKYGSLYEKWRKSPKHSHITFIGYVNADERQALYAAAKMFVYPSIYEGFGLPPLEAMASGAPVISSTSSSLVESVGDAGILVDPYNVSDLTAAINGLLEDELLRKTFVERGKKRAQQFRWNSIAKSVQELIKKLSA